MHLKLAAQVWPEFWPSRVKTNEPSQTRPRRSNDNIYVVAYAARLHIFNGGGCGPEKVEELKCSEMPTVFLNLQRSKVVF